MILFIATESTEFIATEPVYCHCMNDLVSHLFSYALPQNTNKNYQYLQTLSEIGLTRLRLEP